MLVPFYKMGNYFNVEWLNTSITKIEIDVFGNNEILQKIINLVNSQILAIFGWLFLCVPMALIIYFFSLFIYRKYLNRKKLSIISFEKN
jgi:site-specific recombinase